MDEYRENAIAVQKALNQDAAFIQPNPYLAQRVLNQAHEAQRTGGSALKKKLSTGLILLAVLLMSSLVALACSHSYVIRFLFGRDIESDQAQAMAAQVQPIDYVQRSGATVCTVKDAYFDGKTLAVGLGFRTDRPVYLVGEELQLNGEWIDYLAYSTSIEEMWVGNDAPHLEKPGEEAIHGVSYDFARPLPKGETVDVTLRLFLLAPRSGVQLIDTEQEDKAAMWAAIDDAFRQGLTPVSADEPYEVLISTGWWAGSLDVQEGLQKPLCDRDALEHYANMVLLDKVEVTFRLNAQ